jgi:hypothetical protein
VRTGHGLRVLSVYEGFFSGGARIAHTDVVLGLAEGGQRHRVLSLHAEVYREATRQRMEDDACHRALSSAGVVVSALDRAHRGHGVPAGFTVAGRGIVTPADPSRIATAWSEAVVRRAALAPVLAASRELFSRTRMVASYAALLEEVYAGGGPPPDAAGAAVRGATPRDGHTRRGRPGCRPAAPPLPS